MATKKKSGKASTGTAMVAGDAANSGAVISTGNTQLPDGFKVKRQVIVPTLNLQIGAPKVLICTGKMFVSTFQQTDVDGKKQEPATIMPVGDTETGEALNLLVGKVLESTLNETYPDDSYVGLTFYMEKLPKKPGKRYFAFKLLEVEAS